MKSQSTLEKSIKLTILLIAFIFNTTANAQTNSPKLENSLLWEVSGNELSKPSYLYGTIHMICSGDYFLTDKTKKAFDASNKLVLEINFSDPKEMADAKELTMGKEPLSKKLTEEQFAKLDAILKKTAKVSAKQVDAFTLATVMSLVTMKSYGCTDIKQYEVDFMDMAKKKNIEIGELETVKSQALALENAYTNDEMILMIEKLNPDEIAKAVKAYKEENVMELNTVFADEKCASKKTNSTILEARNANWVKKMPALMKSESVFFAVGSAHLGGELGVINLLRKAGYIVKPVMN
ncbi:hypothetical protein EV144_102829 [Flavobacterium sp. 270]|uniref:TraB/GumN family protein n=1 Tax=Flavobacterium sp. 270 TaxID=2512114 RepID=UPI00106569C8|nr:TraB/GumN family protein [Flavobacterium sp. 270]TDW50390.1 hypothetical protein EV144_102829 [Flavobacterium sp. 270]